MNKSERKKLKKLKKMKVRRRIPIAPPRKAHKTIKDYRRVKKVDVNAD